VLARDPDSVDEAPSSSSSTRRRRTPPRIAAEGARTATAISGRASSRHRSRFRPRRATFLAEDEPETFAPVELFREHEDFMTVVARLVEREYRQAGAAQAQLNQLTSELLHTTVIFAGSSVLLALLFAIITVRMGRG